MTVIKNIIFDIGNVLLKWDSKAIISLNFPGYF
jgi:FMN phosphatase YigB (HAD superfamily)